MLQAREVYDCIIFLRASTAGSLCSADCLDVPKNVGSPIFVMLKELGKTLFRDFVAKIELSVLLWLL